MDGCVVTILGCGASTGVPRSDGMWGDCDQKDHRNKRYRCSIMIDFMHKWRKIFRLLIDTSPDLRMQMLENNFTDFDAIMYTHEHADHTHGINDIRPFALRKKAPITAFANEVTKKNLLNSFNYCFYGNKTYNPIIYLYNLIDCNSINNICMYKSKIEKEITISLFKCRHGETNCLGIIYKNFMYTPDISQIDDWSLFKKNNIKYWILDAVRYKKHVSHSHFDQSIYWAQKSLVKKCYLTNLGIDMDYKQMKSLLRKKKVNHFIEPCYDGMKIYIRD